MKTKYFETAYLYDMKNNEHLMLSEDIKNCLNEQSIVTNTYPEASAAYIQAVEQEDQAMFHIRKSRYTPRLQELESG